MFSSSIEQHLFLLLKKKGFIQNISNRSLEKLQKILTKFIAYHTCHCVIQTISMELILIT